MVGEREVDVVLADGDDLLEVLGAGQRAGDRDLLAVGERAAHGDHVAVVRATRELVVSRTSTPRSCANSGALT